MSSGRRHRGVPECSELEEGSFVRLRRSPPQQPLRRLCHTWDARGCCSAAYSDGPAWCGCADYLLDVSGGGGPGFGFALFLQLRREAVWTSRFLGRPPAFKGVVTWTLAAEAFGGFSARFLLVSLGEAVEAASCHELEMELLSFVLVRPGMVALLAAPAPHLMPAAIIWHSYR